MWRLCTCTSIIKIDVSRMASHPGRCRPIVLGTTDGKWAVAITGVNKGSLGN